MRKKTLLPIAASVAVAAGTTAFFVNTRRSGQPEVNAIPIKSGDKLASGTKVRLYLSNGNPRRFWSAEGKLSKDPTDIPQAGIPLTPLFTAGESLVILRVDRTGGPDPTVRFLAEGDQRLGGAGVFTPVHGTKTHFASSSVMGLPEKVVFSLSEGPWKTLTTLTLKDGKIVKQTGDSLKVMVSSNMHRFFDNIQSKEPEVSVVSFNPTKTLQSVDVQVSAFTGDKVPTGAGSSEFSGGETQHMFSCKKSQLTKVEIKVRDRKMYEIKDFARAPK